MIFRTGANKLLRDKEFGITKNGKYDRYRRGLASKALSYFEKRSAAHKETGINLDTVSDNQKLAKKLRKPVSTFFI